jgi:hypothetical protein
MCKANFVDFNLARITSGLTLSFLHLCLLTVLALVPKTLLLRRFIRSVQEPILRLFNLQRCRRLERFYIGEK